MSSLPGLRFRTPVVKCFFSSRAACFFRRTLPNECRFGGEGCEKPGERKQRLFYSPPIPWPPTTEKKKKKKSADTAVGLHPSFDVRIISSCVCVRFLRVAGCLLRGHRGSFSHTCLHTWICRANRRPARLVSPRRPPSSVSSVLCEGRFFLANHKPREDIFFSVVGWYISRTSRGMHTHELGENRILFHIYFILGREENQLPGKLPNLSPPRVILCSRRDAAA